MTTGVNFVLLRTVIFIRGTIYSRGWQGSLITGGIEWLQMMLTLILYTGHALIPRPESMVFMSQLDCIHVHLLCLCYDSKSLLSKTWSIGNVTYVYVETCWRRSFQSSGDKIVGMMNFECIYTLIVYYSQMSVKTSQIIGYSTVCSMGRSGWQHRHSPKSALLFYWPFIRGIQRCIPHTKGQ